VNRPGLRNSNGTCRVVAFAASVVLAASVANPVVAQERVAVDRWLVSSAFQADSTGNPLETDYLSGPGEVAVLPDRGRTVAGADWTLVREDSVPTLDLDDRRGELDGPVVVYAHAYIKAPEDRTISLTWGGIACTEVSAWLNGRSLDELGRLVAGSGDEPGTVRADVRIGFGYNTFLLKAASGDCPLQVRASIEAAEQGSLDGVRVQASQPYGDTRTGPSTWLIADREAGPEPILGWKEDELFGAAGVRLAAFAVTPIEGVRLKTITGGEEIKREIQWLTPAEPETILMPFAFKNLHRAVTRDGGLELELDWDGGKSRSMLHLRPAALLEAFHSSIRLLGWTRSDARGAEQAPIAGVSIVDSENEPHPLANLIPLPTAAGTTLVGEWQVPGWLSGFTLRLDVDGAPGEYRLGALPVESDAIVLCADCRKGQRIQLVVRTEGEWTRFPGARVADSASPDPRSADEAIEWLKMLDEKGSRKYRERTSSATPGQ